MWILPRLKAKSLTEKPVHVSSFPFTNHRIALKVFRWRRYPIDSETQRWFPISSLDSIPIPSPHRRALCALLGIER
jgi:hypothetical protein